MNIVLEINHPAQAHLFRNTIGQLNEHGHSLTVLIKESKIIRNILSYHDIGFVSLGHKGKGLFGKGVKQMAILMKINCLQMKHKFDLGIGVSVSLSSLSKFSSLNSIILDDDDKTATPLFAFFAHHTADTLLRPHALSHEGFKKNTVYYAGYHELAYLHPAFFTPDRSVLRDQGLMDDEPFFLIRTVALKAHHDRGIHGICKIFLQQLVSELKTHGRVIITSEDNNVLPEGAEQININPARIHDLMAFSRLVVSDGQTMCSESACLGVPSVRINDFVGRISTLTELEHQWKLTFGFKPEKSAQALLKIQELLKEPRETFIARRDEMLSHSINVTAFLTWFIETYPNSFHIMKQNPAYQYNFK